MRWGTELHDRFMLPHFVEQDFDDVLDELRAGRLPVRQPTGSRRTSSSASRCSASVDARGHRSWSCGRRIEPWHVLGEEPAAGGTARYVDSSVERLQVKVSGLTDAAPRRHLQRPPRAAAPDRARNGEFVAGVRYRAWQPPSCLHPTIPVHAPLVFDLSTPGWTARSAAAPYHVAHPGGRSYEQFPVNAYEAESRRQTRFLRWATRRARRSAPRGAQPRLPADPRPAPAGARPLWLRIAGRGRSATSRPPDARRSLPKAVPFLDLSPETSVIRG